jgi:hypothetical protein
MHATLSEPFLLSTYGLPKRSFNGISELNRGPSYIYLSHSKAKSSDGYATIAAQGDGVHVLDVSLDTWNLSVTLLTRRLGNLFASGYNSYSWTSHNILLPSSLAYNYRAWNCNVRCHRIISRLRIGRKWPHNMDVDASCGWGFSKKAFGYSECSRISFDLILNLFDPGFSLCLEDISSN